MKSNDAVISLPEAAERLGIGRNQAYRAAKAGEIPTVRIGRLILVPVAGLEKMLTDASIEPTRATERSKALQDDIAAIKLEHARMIENVRLERIKAEEKRKAERTIEREKNAKVFVTAKIPRAMKEALTSKADKNGSSINREIQIAIDRYLNEGSQ